MNLPDSLPVKSVDPDSIVEIAMSRLTAIAPRPTSISETGLSESFLCELAARHLLEGGVLTLSDLSQRLALAGPIVEGLLNFMRSEAQIEVRGPDSTQGNAAALRYALTDRGRRNAKDSLLRSGYTGPAPVSLPQYLDVCRAQTVHNCRITEDDMQSAFADITIRPEILDQLGPAMNSGRAIFIYGPAGTGKTYITQMLVRLFSDMTLIPHAIEVGGSVVEVFDPVIHKPVATTEISEALMFNRGHDPRFACCKRPVVISGGELTADMLEIHYNPETRQYQAPLQLKANNGLLIIDDMGRQRISPEEVFNRWIVPMEEKRDYLTLGAGRHFSIPFDTVLIFSTNLHPHDLADEAFLRRIGYKIEFPYLQTFEYEQIWNQFCTDNHIKCEPDVLPFVINDLHHERQVPLLPCHPRDLLSMAADQATYRGGDSLVNKTHLLWAWHSYFVSLEEEKSHRVMEDGNHG